MENYNYLSFILLKDDPRVVLEVIDKLEDLGVKFDLDEKRSDLCFNTGCVQYYQYGDGRSRYPSSDL